ncbi:cysteine synthase A [Dethiosulfovibrio sp. F2B]|uniref:cysteine synthase A n=1 Tax=Dethiosulfovibrio faecalis TaxID=2720018 RepID=UPI001F2DF949|nr:cysteine synthase A [Dethiosulfovibrio faecalis]MCF4151716.1 cysteine synthase A [Dethiosulfovibrio faecalis]
MSYRVDELMNARVIGKTPMVVVRPFEDGAEIALKIEGNGVGGSIKDRAAWGMLRRAEERGELCDGTVVVEPTSGNTGIALAMLGRGLGLKVMLTMPESMSIERRSLLKAYGAEVVLTPAGEGMTGAVRRAEELVAEIPGALTMDQFSNPGNPWAHRVTTGQEILRDLWGRRIDAFVAGVGTGGTLTGIAEALRGAGRSVSVVAVEPKKSSVLSGGRSGSHDIQGIGAGFVPKVLDVGLIDEIFAVDDEEAREGARLLVSRWGLLCGISSGANLHAAVVKAREIGPEGLVVTVLPDRGEKYLSTGLFS